MNLTERMSRVCKAVIKAKCDYVKEYEMFFFSLDVFNVQNNENKVSKLLTVSVYVIYKHTNSDVSCYFERWSTSINPRFHLSFEGRGHDVI